MKRALQLARNGEGRVSPNPMVGAVIVYQDSIIGEGYHANYGGPHAEVNAINSVREEDRKNLKDSTMYVTLEPCAHYGKTPPCANLLVDMGIRKVVVGILDPNKKVAGKGVEILRNNGAEVKVGLLEEECREINRRFLKAHSSDYPWIILKWAQSSDGLMAAFDDHGNSIPFHFSNPLTLSLMHRERSAVDAIIVGSNTEKNEHPRLDVRYWGGNSPKKYVAEGNINLNDFLKYLRKEGVTSLMVEGGPKLLESFIKEGFYDEIRKEISPINLEKGLRAPDLPSGLKLKHIDNFRGNVIETWSKK